MIKKQTICDVCGSDIDHRDHYHINPRQMQVLRNFDDTEGRVFKKHLVIEEIHICSKCLSSVLENGTYLVDNRVQGHGEIELKEKQK